MSIWENKELKEVIGLKDEQLLSLDEGQTPLEVSQDGSNQLFLKREDLNPTGSWKDRGTCYKINVLKNENVNEVAISSSGNAAISLIEYAKLIPELKVNIVLSPRVNKNKLEILQQKIQGTKHEIFFDDHPKRKRAEIVSEKKAKLFSSSIDNDLVKGYWSLGLELGAKLKGEQNKQNVLICSASSGAALVGLLEGLLLKTENEYIMPKVIVCQTQSCHPIYDQFYENIKQENNLTTEQSLADAIIDKSALRSHQILKSVRQTTGDVLKINNEELKVAKKWMIEKKSLELSYNSLLPVAGYLRIKEQNSSANFFLIVSGR